MKSSLGGVRRRVESLDRLLRPACGGGSHTVHRIDSLFEGESRESLPAWPAPGAPEFCVCGAKFRYFRVINAYMLPRPDAA